MPQIIDVPGHGMVSFPDEMDDAAIVAAIKKLVPSQQPQAPAQPQEQPRQPVSVPPEQLEPLNLTRTEQFAGDIYRGVKQLEQIGFGLGGMAADAVGLDGLAETALDKYAKVGEEANLIPRKIQDWTQIRSAQDLLDYSVQFIGEQLPMAIPSLVTGGAGGLIMRQAGEKAAAALVTELTAKGIAKDVAVKTAAKALAKQTAKGALIGAAPSAVGLEAGSIYGDIAEKTGQRAPGTAAVFGTLAGALDVIPSMLLLNKIVGPAVGHEVARGLARRVGAAAAEQILSEGLTEGAQTVLERYAVQKIDPNQRTFSKEGVIEIVDSMLGGAIVGGTMGAGGGAIDHLRQPKAQPAKPAELPADDKAKLDAARIEREDKLNSPAPDFRAAGTRALPIPEEAQPLASDFVGRTIDSEGTPIGTIVGTDQVGLIVHYKGRNQPTVLPYESVGLKPGVNVRLEAKPAPMPEAPKAEEKPAAPTAPPEPPKPEIVTPVTQTATPVTPSEEKPSFLTDAQWRMQFDTRDENDLSDQEYRDKSGGRTLIKRFKETGKLGDFLRGKGIEVDSFLKDPNNHITFIGQQADGSYEVRVERHSEGTVSADLVNVKPGESLSNPGKLEFIEGQGTVVRRPDGSISRPNRKEEVTPESVTPVTQNATPVTPLPKEQNAVQEQVPAANDVRQAPANSEALGQGNAQNQGSTGESPAQKQESGSPPRKVGVRRKPQQQTEVIPSEKEQTKEGLQEVGVTSHGDAGGVLATAQPASDSAPTPGVEKIETINPPPIAQGDWIEWTDEYGKVRQGKVNAIWKTGKFIPGQGAQTPKIEYSTNVGTAREEQSPKKIEEPAPVAKPKAEAQVKPEVTNETVPTGPTGATGQPVENPPPLDVRPPAEPSPQPAQTGAAGPAPRPEVPASPASSPGPEKTGSGGKRGVRRGNVGSPGTVGSVQPGEPAAANTGPGTAQDNSGTAGVTAPPAEETKPQPPPESPPKIEKGPNDVNHVLPRDQDWIPSGDKSRVRANLEAIKLVKQLETENRNPTPEEKQTLSKYVGWGGLKSVFDEGKAAARERKGMLWGVQEQEYNRWEKAWGSLYDEVKKTLTPEEWSRAAASILNAHYTSRTVINGVWDAVSHLGFKGGVALEPAGGIGHFIGLQPDPSRAKTRWAAVELDDISARILQKLYPEAKVQNSGFEKSRIPANSVDLVISNVPFAKDGPIDKRYPKFSLHNYFFARALDLVKPGGLVAFITSTSTMDNAASRAARDYMAERADLVGAMRLPNDAFADNAGTEVTTDVLFFRKRDGSPFQGQDFTRTTEAKTYKGEPVEINQYFAAHPEMMLGRMSLEGTMYGGKEPALLPTPGADLSKQMQGAIAKLPGNVFGAQQSANDQPISVEAATGKVGGLSFRDGKPSVLQSDGSVEVPDWADKPAKVAQAKLYVSVRDKAQGLISLMLSQESTDEQIAASREELNKAYDAYVKKHGPVNGRSSAFLEDDVDFPLALALEDSNTKLVESQTAKGKTITRRITDYFKSKIFSERTIFPREAPARVDTPEDGYQVSMNFRGRVDPDYIAELTSQTVDVVKTRLQESGLAFEDPKSGKWEPAWRYLSGDVKTKLEEARQLAEENPRYQDNVNALEKVQPEPIAFENISFKLGNTFIEPSIVTKFLREKLGLSDAEVIRSEATGNWIVTSGWKGTSDALNTTTYGIHGINGAQMVELALNLKTPTVMTYETRISETTGKPYQAEVKAPKETLEATGKQAQVKQAFIDWVKTDHESAKKIETRYNETSNRSRIPTFEPPTWTHYPNASKDITLRPHQMRVVTRMLQESAMLAHAVGTGKTYVQITAAMEMRRLGLAKKPMIVVQNATIEQFARSFKRLYPAARILVPSPKQRDSKNRSRTMSRIATGDWDAVIIPQSFVNRLPDDPEREQTYISDQIDQLKDALISAKAESGERAPKAADIQRAINRLERTLDELKNRPKDNVLTFEQLGVDAMLVDEFHNFKKLQFTTKMENIKGLDTGASQRGLSMFLKLRWVQEHNQGRNTSGATGTPVSNTIAEVWTMMRYFRPDILARFDMETFDDFAGNFGDTVTNTEMTAGGTWKDVTRFARYTNGPELIAAWQSVADVITAEEVNLPGLPTIEGGKAQAVVIKQTPEIKSYIQHLRAELEAFEAMSGKQKRENSHIPLVVFGRAKKASLDMRLIDSSMPDNPSSKVNKVVEEIVKIYQESTPVKGAQMVFADLFQSPEGQFNLFEDIKKKLIARGIPESEILIIDDKLKDAKRETAFNNLNDGNIRVALGSTERMGVGVNAQEHLIALHHMDAPARPMDVEQRNGRIVRQGNQNPNVYIKSYGVENTLDAALFQRLATKQKFINQILRGDINGRNFEDAANEVSMSFEEQMAAFSGDPLAAEKVALENQIRNLESIRSAHFEQVRKGREEVDRLTNRGIPFSENQLASAKDEAARLAKDFADMDAVQMRYGERVVTGKKEIATFLEAKFKAALDQARAEAMKMAGDKAGTFRYSGPIPGFRIQGIDIELTAKAASDMGWADEAMTKTERKIVEAVIEWNLKGDKYSGGRVTSGNGFFNSFDGYLRGVARKPETIQGELDLKHRQVRQLESFVKQPFDQENQLANLKKRYDEVLSSIKAASAAPVKSSAPQVVAPLGFEVTKAKPIEGQRAHIVRLLDQIENRREQEDLPPGYKQSLVAALKERLQEIETEMLNKARGVTPKNESLTGWDTTEPGTDQKFLAPDEVKAAIENEPMLDGVGFEVVNVPEMRSVAGAFGYNSQGRPVMFLNAAGITSPEQAVEVLREEQGHALLSTPEGRQKVLAFADERMTEEERKDLMGTYAKRPGESSEAYRERLANEFIAKSGRQKNGFWRELIERLKAWFAERGLGTLTNEQAARAILRKLSRDVDAGVLTPGSLPSDAAKESLQPISSKGEFNKLTASENLMHPTDALFQAQLFGSQNQAAIGHMVGAFNALAPEVQAVLPTISGRMDVIDLSRNAAQRISGAPWTPPSGDLATMAGQFSAEPWAQAMFVSLAQNEMMNIQAETAEHMKETAKAAAEAKAELKAERKRLPMQRMSVLANEIINFRRGQLLAERAAAMQAGNQVAEAAANTELSNLQNTAAAVLEVIKAILANVPDALIRSPLTPREDIMKAWAAKRPGAVIAASPEIVDSVEKTLAQMPDLNVRLDAISHPEKSAKVRALEKRAATMSAGASFLQALLQSPEFQSNYKWAIDKTGSRALVAKENADHNLSWDNPLNPEESVTLRPGFSEDDYKHNVQALQTAKTWFEDYLDPKKNPDQDPLKVAGIQVQLWAIDNVHLSQQFNPQTGKLLGGGANAFDLLIRAAGGIMDVPDYIIELSGGAPAAASMGALNNYAEAQRETQRSDNRLSVSTSKAVLAASKEHGMDVATWLTEIGDEISGSYQNIGTPRVRVGDKVLGHTVTQADIDAVAAQKAYVDGITASARKSLETPSGAPAPIKIRDVVGETGFERNAQPTSELTVPQRPTANAFGFVDDWNAIKEDGTMSDRQKLDAWERLLNGKFFRQGLVGHVRSFEDPQYASAAKSPFRSDYIKLLRDINDTGVVPFGNLNDLVDTIFAAQQGLPVAQQMTQAEIKGKIVREINGAVDRFSDENRGEKMLDPDKSKVSVISAENFMNRPRGKRALPKTFYTYTVGTKAEQDQIRFHVLEVFGQRLLNAVQAQLDAVTKQLSEWSQAIKEQKLTEEQIREDQKAGKNFLNYSEAVTVRANLERFIEAFRTYTLRNMGQEFRLYQWPNLLRGTVANAMLQRAPTLLANYLGAAFQKALLDATVMRAGKSFLLRFAPVGAAYATAKSITQHGLQTVNAAVGMILNQPEVSPRLQALATYIRANQGFFSKFAGMVTDYAERQRARVAALKESGILEDDPWRYNLDALKSMPAMGGRLSSERRGPTGKALELLKTAILLANETGVGLQLPRAMGVSAIESFNNAMSDKATTDILHDLLMFSGRSFATRQANGYDPQSSILTPEEIFGRAKASAADAAQLRQMFSRAGLNMDRVLIEHWQAVQSGAQRTLEDTLGAQGKAAIMREVAKWLNKGGFANRPFYNSSLGRFAGLFLGYGINQNAQLARLFASYSKDNRNPLWRNLDHFETAVVMFVLLSLFGAAFQPAAGWLKRFFYREEHPVRPIWKSRNLTEAFLTDLQNMANSMPLLGRVFVNTLGAATPGTQLGMFGMQLFPVSAGNTLMQAFSKGWQTGDWGRVGVELMRNFIPNSRVLLNRISSREGLTNETALRNILSANAPTGIELNSNPYQTGTVRYSPARAHIDDVVNALSRPGGINMAEVRTARDQGMAALVAAGKSRDDAARAFDSSIMSRNPFLAVYGRNLTQTEMAELRSSVSPEQLTQIDAVVKGRQAYAREFGLTEPDYIRDAGARASGGVAGASDMASSPARAAGVLGVRRGAMGGGTGIGSGRLPNPMAERSTGTPRVGGISQISEAMPRGTGIPRIATGGKSSRGLRTRRIRTGRRIGIRRGKISGRVKNSKRIRLRRR